MNPSLGNVRKAPRDWKSTHAARTILLTRLLYVLRMVRDGSLSPTRPETRGGDLVVDHRRNRRAYQPAGGMRGREYVNKFRHRYFVDMQNGLIAMVSGSLLTRHATEEVSSRAISRRAFAVAATAGLMAVLGDMDDGTTRANASTDSDATILLTDR